MAFQVKFGGGGGSQSNVSDLPRSQPRGVHGGRGGGGGGRGGRSRGDYAGGGEGRGEGRGYPRGGRGRGRGGRGRGRGGYDKKRGGGGGGRGGGPAIGDDAEAGFEEGDDDEEEEEDAGGAEGAGEEANSDESDACSIVSTEGGGGRKRGRKRGGRGRKGREGGGGAGGFGEGGAGGERGSRSGYGNTPRGSHQDREREVTAPSSGEKQTQEVHIHYHITGSHPAPGPPAYQQVHPGGFFPPRPEYQQPYPSPSEKRQPYPKHETFTPPIPGQRRPPLVSVLPGNAAAEPQPPSEGPAVTGKSPGFAGIGQPGGKPKPPGAGGKGGQRGGDRGDEPRGGDKGGAKDWRKSDGDSKHKQSDKTRKGSVFGANPQHDADQQAASSRKQQPVGGPSEASGIAPDVPELSPEEGIRVFNILLRELNGRARLGPLMTSCRKGGLLKDLSPAQIAAWLRNSRSFLTFERDGYVKYVSVWSKKARCCFKYKKHGTDKCDNNSCPFLHVCRDFITGCCSRGLSCHFNHNFHAGSNAKICTQAGLQAFTDEEIRTIVHRSGPVACLKFNRGSCQWPDCPDIHVCSRYLRGDCSAVADCKLGHMVKGPEHNEWVLKTFNMTLIQEHTVCKLVVAPKLDHEEATGGAQALSQDSAHKAKNTTEKAAGLKTRQGSMDCLLDHTGTSRPKGRGLAKGRSQENLLFDAEMVLPLHPPTLGQSTTKVSAGAKIGAERIQKNKTDEVCPRVDWTSTQALGSRQQAPPAYVTPRIRTQEAVDPCHIMSAPSPQPHYRLGSDSIAADTLQTPPVVEKPRDIPVKTKVSGRGEAQTGHDLKSQPRDSPGSGGFAAYVERTPPPVPKPRTPLQETSRRGEARSGRDPERQSLAKAAVVDATSAEGTGEGFQHSPASHYAHLCEQYSSTGTCDKGYLCPKFHHPDRLPYVWQVRVFDEWHDFSPADNLDIEERFRALATYGDFQVFLETVGGLEFTLHFQTMSAEVRTEDLLMGEGTQVLAVRRWSTPSYVEADDSNPLGWYTQWCWYRTDRDGFLAPFTPATLQYTLEEKYKHEQKKYYFEEGETRYLILPGPNTHDLVLLDLNEGRQFPVLRRPVSDSALLLNEKPSCKHTNLPAHWSTVDRHQDFEMVELESSGQEYQGVARSFHTTVAREAATILRVFRVQNASVWDRYCSNRRAMTPRGLSEQDVDERKLFHGTPTLDAARGICANNMDFRRSGDNVGAKFGKGAYFSAHAVYSQCYTSPPDRYMFLARVLVGRYTQGQPSYNMPPVREGLRHYDSCVNDEVNPTIFVIFDLAQSYPEYLIQFEDSNSKKVLPMSPKSVPATAPVRQATPMSGMGSGVSGQGSYVSGIVSDLPRPAFGLSGSGSRSSGIVPGLPGSGSGLSRLDPRPAPVPAVRSSVGLRVESRHGVTSVSPRAAATPVSRKVAEKKSENDKCLIS